MELDPSKHYRMPFLLGPMFDKSQNVIWQYSEVDVLVYQYLTNPEVVESFLPECYKPTNEPMVTVFFSEYNGLEFMAGGGYRTATFQVAARFDGEQDQAEGDFILVMFENKTWPILCGREDLGIPKLYADISPMKRMSDGTTRAEASLWGHHLFSLDVPTMKAQSRVACTIAAKRINSRPWLGYKYVPSLHGPPDADYPTTTKNDTKIEKFWLGKSGVIRFASGKADEIGHAEPLINALSTLAVVKPLQTLRFRGSSVLRYDQSHRLR